MRAAAAGCRESRRCRAQRRGRRGGGGEDPGEGVQAINPRGELYTRGNVRQHLSMRNFMDSLRGAGVQTGGPDAFGQRDRQQFAAPLDRLLARHKPACPPAS